MGIGDWFREKFGKEEEPEEITRACDRCGFEYPEVSMVISDDSLFCHDCHHKQKKEIADEEFRKRQAAVMQRMKYYCYECKFHFSRSKEFQIRLCPNCGSENFVEEGRLI